MNSPPHLSAESFAVADRLKTPVWVFDIENLVMCWANAAGVSIWGAGDLEELRSRDFATEISVSARARLRDYLARFKAGETVLETWTLYPNGKPVPMRCVCSGFPLQNGQGMLVEAQPVTEPDIQALRAQEALRHTPTLMSAFDSQGNLLTRNPSATTMLSAGADLTSSFARQSEKKAVRLWAESDAESYSLEAPVQTSAGERWHRVDLRRTFDPATGERVILASETDITARVESETALINAGERFAALLKNLRGGIVVEDENRKMLLANQSFCDMFSIPVPPESLHGMDCAAAAEQSKTLFRDPDSFIAGIEAALLARQTNTDELHLSDGRILERTYIPVFNEQTYVGHLWQYWDITDHKKTMARLEHEAFHDPLTGLWNRRRFEQSLLETHEEAIRYSQPYSLVLVDIDHFKRVNDQFGHDAGDVTLQTLTDELRRRLRQADRLARWGGEEFLLLLPQTKLEGALLLADALRKRVKEVSFPLVGHLTISLGVAEASPEELPQHAVIRADKALFRAKTNGRDRVEGAESVTSRPRPD